MRIVGSVPHPSYKISILHMNNRMVLKIEDGLFEQSYHFRDGEPLYDIAVLKNHIMNSSFLAEVSNIFSTMYSNKVQLSNQAKNETDSEEFDEII